MNPTIELQELLKPELTELDKVITEHYKNTKIELVQTVVENLICAGGKRIRPILILALCRLFNYSDQSAINAAAAIELIHTATLLHDDVVDEADIRRGAKTAKNIWGNKTSILVGDFLLSAAFRCAMSCNNQEVLKTLSDATLVIAEGEIKQLININNIELTYEEYLEVISAKTAKLFEAACSIAAILTGEDIQLLAKFGHSLGMAFQITDDVIDYQAGSGKDRGRDFYNGKVTLPIIIAYKRVDTSEKEFWQRCIVNKEIQDLEQGIIYLEKHGALEKSLSVAKSYTTICDDIMSKLPNKKVRTSLNNLVKFITQRDK